MSSEADTQRLSREQKGKGKEQVQDDNQQNSRQSGPQKPQREASSQASGRSRHESQRGHKHDPSGQSTDGQRASDDRSTSPTVQDNRSVTQSQAGGDTFTWATLQQYQQPKLRIRSDLTKVTSFDRVSIFGAGVTT